MGGVGYLWNQDQRRVWCLLKNKLHCRTVDASPASWTRTATLNQRTPGTPPADTASARVAIQIPAITAPTPMQTFQRSLSPTSSAPTIAAATGFTAIDIATRVGVVRCNANAQRKNPNAPPNGPRNPNAAH